MNRESDEHEEGCGAHDDNDKSVTRQLTGR